jgi:hypothetical protein
MGEIPGVTMKLLLESIADGAPLPRAGRVQESIGVRRRREADDGSQGIVRGGARLPARARGVF